MTITVAKNGANPSGTSVYTLSTTKERDMRPDVARAIVQQGWQLLELRALRLSLEEVFVQLVTEEGEAHA